MVEIHKNLREYIHRLMKAYLHLRMMYPQKVSFFLMAVERVEEAKVELFWDLFVENSITLFINYNHNLFYF